MLLCVCLALLSYADHVLAQDKSYTDIHIQSVYVTKVIDFIDWPPKAQTKKLCVIEASLFGIALARIQSELGTMAEWDIIDRKDNEPLSDCQIIFIGKNINNFDRALSATKDTQALTISNIKNFIDKGGIIGFSKTDRKIKLEVNNKVAKLQNISISSKLLEIANRVIL